MALLVKEAYAREPVPMPLAGTRQEEQMHRTSVITGLSFLRQ